MNTRFFGELLQSIAERGRSLTERTRERRPAGEVRTATFVELCEALLTGRGEASGVALAREILAAYSKLRTGERIAFFEALAESFGPDRVRLAQACAAYGSAPSEENANEVLAAAEPRRQELIRRINLAPGATRELVQMRGHLLDALTRRDDLAPVDRDFVHLLGSWFNRGFLVLKRIDWSMPAIVLEKIIRYEAVHEIQSWDDLRARIDPPDRRCYAFFHPAMPAEPLIFVEIALTNGIATELTQLLDERAPDLDAESADTAVFYSISNCQPGLAGVNLGTALIKEVVEELRHDLPNLERFVTLSPIPGFVDWLVCELEDGADLSPRERELLPAEPGRVLARLANEGWDADEAIRPAVLALCARFLMTTADGRALDPVANFHLANGAAIERINWRADASPNGRTHSAGIMANYLYEADRMPERAEAYVAHGEIAAASAVRDLRAE